MKLSKYNPEGYYDPTPYAALLRMEAQYQATRRAIAVRFRPIVFICSPYASDPPTNERKAIEYCRYAVNQGCIPIAPHIYFTRFLDDADHAERELGLFMGKVLLTKCAQLWVFGEEITSGMEAEISKAKRMGKEIHYINENCEEVYK